MSWIKSEKSSEISFNSRSSFKHLTATNSEVRQLYFGKRMSGLPSNTFNQTLNRSNNNLNVDHIDLSGNLGREYGSAFSIDRCGNLDEIDIHKQKNLTLSSTRTTQEKGSLARIGQYLRCSKNIEDWSTVNGCSLSYRDVSSTTITESMSGSSAVSNNSVEETTSPKFRHKFTKFLNLSSKSDKSKTKSEERSSVFKIMKGSSKNGVNNENGWNTNPNKLSDPETRLEEKLRKKVFAHYDCQSVTASLTHANKVTTILSKRRNTTTGASAASSIGRAINGSDASSDDDGDGRSNDLVQSCRNFRNELGGEEEKMISLNRRTSKQPAIQSPSSKSCLYLHRPLMASGLTLLENANNGRWNSRSCPYQRKTNDGGFIIENCDIGANYYRIHFFGLEHQNWFGIDENFGPIAISIRKERVNINSNTLTHNNGDCSISKSISYTSSNNSLTYIGNSSTNNGEDQHVYTHNKQLEESISLACDHPLSSLSSISSESKTRSKDSKSSSSNSSSNVSSNSNQSKYQYRVIIRTSDLSVLRGTVYEDCVPALSSYRHNHHNHHAKEVLEYIAPELSLCNLRLGTSTGDEQLLKVDEQLLTRNYKVGVIYCRSGQGTEEEMYNNQYSSPEFDEFLTCLGNKVRLLGFEGYRAGLDNKSDTTGKYSIYTRFNDCELMFHVSTLLPYTSSNRQQLLRKRHIGNDIVTIIFQEPGSLPFTPRTMRSQFQHVFIIVRLMNSVDFSIARSDSASGSTSCGSSTSGLFESLNVHEAYYKVAVSRSKEVPVFGPPIPPNGIFVKSKEFTQFLLSKIINGENAAHRSEKFRNMAQRTRNGYLNELATNCVTNTTLNDASCGNSASAKFSSIFGSSKRNRASRVSRDWQFIGKSEIKGAIVWEMSVQDYGQSRLIDCFVGISSDTFVIIEESTKQIIFTCPNISILGWTSHTDHIKIFYHQGECIFLKCKDPDLDEIAEVVTRLKSVTNGCETQELIIKRNKYGQLGFHMGLDGIVTQIESDSHASKAGLKINSRIVEICRVAVATLNYGGMTDLLETSITVTVTLLMPNSDGLPKRGCNLQNCPYLSSMLDDEQLNSNRGYVFKEDYNLIPRSDGMVKSDYSSPSTRKEKYCTRPNFLRNDSIRRALCSYPNPIASNINDKNLKSSDSNSESKRVPINSPNIYCNVKLPMKSHYQSYVTPKKDFYNLRKSATITGPPSSPLLMKSDRSVDSSGSVGSRGSDGVNRLIGEENSLKHVGNMISSKSELFLANQHKPLKQQNLMVNSHIEDRCGSHNQISTGHQPKNDSGGESEFWSSPCTGRRFNDNSFNASPNSTLSSLSNSFVKSPGHKLSYKTRPSPFYENNSNARCPLRKSSSNNSTSPLQETLLKLINPDYGKEDVESGDNDSSYSDLYSRPEPIKKNEEESVILTVAQPAKVISPCREPSPSNVNLHLTNGRLSRESSGSLNDMDWPSFVDTTTAAIKSIDNECRDESQVIDNDNALDKWVRDFGSDDCSDQNGMVTDDGHRQSNNSKSSDEAFKELGQVMEKLLKEQNDRANLEEQLRQLKEENLRLQEESQNATVRLKKFTEWFSKV